MGRKQTSMEDFIDELELEDLARQEQAKKAHERKLAMHPMCADPDHPGCEHCNDSLEELFHDTTRRSINKTYY